MYEEMERFCNVASSSLGIIVWPNTQKVEAASKYIRIDEFIEYIVKQMGWQIDEKSEQPYIDIAIEKVY